MDDWSVPVDGLKWKKFFFFGLWMLFWERVVIGCVRTSGFDEEGGLDKVE